MFLFSLKIQV